MMLQCPIPPGGWRTLRLSRAVFLVSSFLSDRPQCGCRTLRGFAGCAYPRSQGSPVGNAIILRRYFLDAKELPSDLIGGSVCSIAFYNVRYLYCLPDNNLATGPLP